MIEPYPILQERKGLKQIFYKMLYCPSFGHSFRYVNMNRKGHIYECRHCKDMWLDVEV